jgi:hypothetical protein
MADFKTQLAQAGEQGIGQYGIIFGQKQFHGTAASEMKA